MLKVTKFAVLILFLVLFNALCWGKQYPCRWVYVSRSLRQEDHVQDIERIVQTASEHGLNGMVLAAGLDMLDLQDAAYFARLDKVKQICKDHNVEIIPNVFSVGYGSAVLAHDKNLAAGLLVKDALFVVGNGKARLLSDPPVTIENSGLEQYYANHLEGYRLQDRPGEVSFIDTQVFRTGKASLRLENFGKFEHGHARLMQEVEVRPYRCYKLSCWVRTESLAPEGSLRMAVMASDGRELVPWEPRVPSTSPWRQVLMGFNSLNYNRVRVYVGVWGGKSGKFWVDDLEIEEVGLINVLRRPGTPITVKSESTGQVYEEGTDYAEIKDTKLNFRFDHDPPVINVLANSGIKDGQRLRVSYYHGLALSRGQVPLCMSEPKLYELWRARAELVQKYLSPSKYLLSMDEIRAGGACEACKERKMTMGQILGDCITKQVGIIRQVNPQAEVLIWSDMLDPNHNAHGNYYLVDGDFAGSWNFIPKDLAIVCWYYQKRTGSLKFFSSLGFKTIAAAYYDTNTLDNPKGWLAAMDKTPNTQGIIYTTWQNKYELLAPFSDLVAGKKD